ncbi:hypothetical protein [Sphingobacterium sp. UBA2074]|uniref:hypothetical protein n=1 Tax=Sphingobacterium sp. UBA2074 TaxID=1947487 RepID=UPI002579D334|nr:hypothetical protein [Sphingobacterium sp. UBA2074]
MNSELLELIKQQEKHIEQLKKFIWDISVNPDLLKDQRLMNILIDIDFNNSSDPTLTDYTISKIIELEKRLFQIWELLDQSRRLINRPWKVLFPGKGFRACYNAAVDQHACEWVDDKGNVVESQEQ